MEKAAKQREGTSPETIEVASTVGVGVGASQSAIVETSVHQTSLVQSDTNLRLRPRGRYELLGELARGGLGRVWRARDRELNRIVALKEILVPSHEAGARFLREVQITARLEHPSIIPVHDAGIWDSGEPFYAMKLVSGRTLEELVQDHEQAPLATRLAFLPNLIAVSDAVAYAHAQGVIHRDIKPSNIMVGAFGETVLVDWGIAKDLHADARHVAFAANESAPYRAPAEHGTAVGAVLGTPAFMAPEQARGEEATTATDIYAVGTLVYYVLAGKPPHAGRTLGEVLGSARESKAPRIEQHNASAPRDLVAIANKAMSPKAADRYDSAELLARDLKRYQMGQAVSARAYSVRELAARWVSRNRALTVSMVSFALIALAGITGFVIREQHLRKEAEQQRDRADAETRVLLEQQGRSELAAGRPFRAAPYLAEAYRQAPSSVALRALLSETLVPLGMHRIALVGHTLDVPAAAYSPDGTKVVTGSSDKTARIWNIATGTSVTLEGHTKWVEAVAFSPDGLFVVTAGDSTLRIWRSDTGAPVREVADPGAYRVVFTPDGKRLVAGDQRGDIRIHDIESGTIIKTLKMHTDRVFEINFSPNGAEMIVANLDRTASIWDTTTWAQLLVIKDHETDVVSACYSHDGAWILTTESDAYLHVRNAKTGQRSHTIRLPDGARYAQSSFLPGDQTILTRSHDGVVRIWHAASGALLLALDTQAMGKLMGSAVRGDGGEFTTVGVAGSVNVWSLTGKLPFRVLQAGNSERAHIYPSEYSGDGQRIATEHASGDLRLWNADDGKLVSESHLKRPSFSLAVNRDGTRIATSAAGSKPFFPPELWTPEAIPASRELAGHSRFIHNLAIATDGSEIATASYDGSVHIVNVETGALVKDLPISNKRMTAVTFHPAGQHIAATDEDGWVHIVDKSSASERLTFRAHPTWIQDIEYSKDGMHLITAGRQDHAAKIWHAATGKLEVALTPHENNLMHASFNDDGSLVATVGLDHRAHIWESKTGVLVRTIVGPGYSATFRPGKLELFTSGYFGYGVVWDLTPDPRSPAELVSYVAARSPWKLSAGQLVLKNP